MSLATKDTTRQHLAIPRAVVQKGQTPPPESVSAIVTKNHKSGKIPSSFRVGDRVIIFSLRENRHKYNRQIGQVCAVVWPNDATRSIIYVKVAGMQPCFLESELMVAPQAEEGVQICQ
jgi:hypothetical protein